MSTIWVFCTGNSMISGRDHLEAQWNIRECGKHHITSSREFL